MPLEDFTAAPMPASATLRTCPGGLLGILSQAGAQHLVALGSIAAGQAILRIDGTLSAQPSRHSVQVGVDLHVAPEGDPPEHGFWRYLNHSCDPNAWLRGRELIALRDIQAREGVSFDYNTTEWDMAEPFACHCGSAACLGTVRGYAHLSAAQRGRLHGVAPHLQAAIASTTG